MGSKTNAQAIVVGGRKVPNRLLDAGVKMNHENHADVVIRRYLHMRNIALGRQENVYVSSLRNAYDIPKHMTYLGNFRAFNGVFYL